MSMDYIKKQMDDVKTAAEHENIILKYKNTGYLDRDDAIKKYIQFNAEHTEYCASMNAASTAAGTAAPIEKMPDNVIVGNLNAQLCYLMGKKLMEDKNNG